MIPWYVYAFLSVIFGILFVISRKKALLKVHAMNFESVRTLIVAILALFLIPFVNLKVNLNTLALVYVASLIGAIGILLVSKAIRHKEISLVYPLVNIKPVFVVILAYIFLSETLQIKQIIGIGLILVSAYLLESDHHFSDFFKPLKKIVTSKHDIYFLIAIFLFSVTSIFDKYIITYRMDIFSYFLLTWIFIAINFNIIHLIEFGFKDALQCFKEIHYLPLFIGFFSFASDLFALKALSLTFVSILTPVLVLTTLFVVFFGGRFFNEKYFLLRTIISLFMLIGVYLIVM